MLASNPISQVFGHDAETNRHWCRLDPVTAHIPVIAFSGNAMPLNIESGLEAGFFRYITKPVEVDEFEKALNAALEFAGQTAGQSK